MDWQPIETAPRDGTEILVWGPTLGHLGDSGFAVVTFVVCNDGNAFWRVAVGPDGRQLALLIGVATYWMPLPAPPRPPHRERVT